MAGGVCGYDQSPGKERRPTTGSSENFSDRELIEMEITSLSKYNKTIKRLKSLESGINNKGGEILFEVKNGILYQVYKCEFNYFAGRGPKWFGHNYNRGTPFSRFSDPFDDPERL